MQTHIVKGPIKTGLLSVTRLRFMELFARALNRKVSPYNRSLYKPVTVEVLFLLVFRDTHLQLGSIAIISTLHPA